MVKLLRTLDDKSFRLSKKHFIGLACTLLIGMGILCMAAQETQELGQPLELDRLYRLTVASSKRLSIVSRDRIARARCRSARSGFPAAIQSTATATRKVALSGASWTIDSATVAA